jgi:hypothetical protein
MNSSIEGKGSPSGLILSLLFSALLVISNTAHAALEEFPAPSWLNRIQVGEKMIINGIPSVVQHFEAYKELNELLEFYRKEWNGSASGTAGYREAQVAPWYIISRLEGSYLYTVQVQEEGAFKIRGYLAIADLKAMKKTLKNDSLIPQMRGSRIINDVTSFDPGKKGRTLMLVNTFSVASNANFYRSHYLERGWAIQMDTNSEEAFVMVFKKRNKETHLVINHIQGSTQIVMNIVEGV